MQRRDKTIIQFVMDIKTNGYMQLSVTNDYIREHRDQLSYSYSAEKLNQQIFFETDNYSERGELGRVYNGFCLSIFDPYQPDDAGGSGSSVLEGGYIQFRLYMCQNGNALGTGAHIASYMIEHFATGSEDSSFALRIEHTRSYIKIWHNIHTSREDASVGGTLMFNITADQYPQIATQFGQYICNAIRTIHRFCQGRYLGFRWL